MNGTRKRAQQDATRAEKLDAERVEKRARTDDADPPPSIPSESSSDQVGGAEGTGVAVAPAASPSHPEEVAKDDGSAVRADASPTPSAKSVPANTELSKPATTKPTTTRPATTKPTTTKPAPAKPAAVKPAAAKPAVKTVKMKDGVERPMIIRVVVVVTAEDVMLTDVEREYVTEELIERVLPMLNFKDVKTNRFSIGCVPLNVDWGTLKLGPDMDRYITNDNGRLTTWFIGLVTTVWLTPREGTRINIGVKLLTQRDHDAARHLQYDISVPAMNLLTAGDTVFCSRFLNTRAEEGGRFEDVYDAYDRLLPWGQMRRIDASRVQKTDLVLVECCIKRFRSKDRSKGRGWQEWAVNFDLMRIALLSPGPGSAKDLVPDDCDVDL